MSHKDLMVGAACGLAVGAVAGAVAALLLAPASGTETRRRLRYEREQAVEVARRNTRWAMTRLGRTQSAPATETEEDEVAFSGA